MDKLTEILITELEAYVGEGIDSLIFPIFDEKRQHYALAIMDYPSHDNPADLIILTRIVGDKIVIEEDMTDRKLVNALLQRGVPREQIVLAYEDEKAPAPPIPLVYHADQH